MIASSNELRVIVVEYVDNGTGNIGWVEEIAVVGMLEAVIFLLHNTLSSKLQVSM